MLFEIPSPNINATIAPITTHIIIDIVAVFSILALFSESTLPDLILYATNTSTAL